MDRLSLPTNEHACQIASWILAGATLVIVLQIHVLPALLGGLLVYQLVHVLAPRLKAGTFTDTTGRTIAVAVVGGIVVLALSLAIIGLVGFFRSEAGSLPALVERMASILESARDSLPAWVAAKIPVNTEELQIEIVQWLRDHAVELRFAGSQIGRGLVQVLIGMIIGALIALDAARPDGKGRPLAIALTGRVSRLAEAFRRIVFAQIRISALNTTLTTIYLTVVLPSFGVHLPFTKTMIAITFIVGLMPVIGNLVSNTVIVIVSLSASLFIAIASLVFLVIIHKLEYFINARIVGSSIHAHAWELLIAMLVMEAAFGIGGLVAAPVYYAYLKLELGDRELV
jgi:predicted PurR-regulated permease PerM